MVIERKHKFYAVKSKQTSTCLEIHLCDFRCIAVEVSCQKNISNELNGLRKTFGIKIMIFSQHFALRTVNRLLVYAFNVAMHVQKAIGFKLHMTYANFTCILHK